MSQFSDNMAQVALELIREFGEPVSFSRVTVGVYNPSTASSSSDVTVSYSGFGAPMEYANKDIDGTVIQRGDFRVLAHKMSEVPEVGDGLLLGSITCRIISVNTTKVNGASLLYSLQCRV